MTSSISQKRDKKSKLQAGGGGGCTVKDREGEGVGKIRNSSQVTSVIDGVEERLKINLGKGGNQP